MLQRSSLDVLWRGRSLGLTNQQAPYPSSPCESALHGGSCARAKVRARISQSSAAGIRNSNVNRVPQNFVEAQTPRLKKCWVLHKAVDQTYNVH